jgi:nucleoid-associated protein YgaU
VNRVARPILDIGPAAGGPLASAAVHTPTIVLGASSESAAERFERASPADTAVTAPAIDEDALSLAAPEELGGPFVQAELPPLHVIPEPSTPAAATEPTLRRPPSLSALAAQSAPDVVEASGSPNSTENTATQEMGTSAAESGAVLYRVQRGDSLSKIARRTWGSDGRRYIRMLMDANPRVARRGGRLLAGEEIAIPGRGGSTEERLAARGDSIAAARSSTATVRNESTPGAEGSARPGGGSRAAGARGAQMARSYTIRNGDSLHGIAQRVLKDAGRWREIAELNGLKDANKLIPGARLKLPAGGLGMSLTRLIVLLAGAAAVMLTVVALRAETTRIHNRIGRIDQEAESLALELRQKELELARLKNPTLIRARVGALRLPEINEGTSAKPPPAGKPATPGKGQPPPRRR